MLVRLYAVNRLAGPVLWLVRRLEGPELTSPTVRRIFTRCFAVQIGMYSHGAFFEPYAVDEQTTIGRYCSMARGARIVNHNHPLGLKSTSGIFFNPHYGLCERSLVQFNPLVVGNDVWIGSNAVILPEVNRIGDGAIIGASASSAVTSRRTRSCWATRRGSSSTASVRTPSCGLLEEQWCG